MHLVVLRLLGVLTVSYCGTVVSVVGAETGLVGRCDEVGSPENVTQEDIEVFFNCTVIPSNTVCVPVYEEGVDRVYVLDEDFFVDAESISNELEIVLMLIDEPCKTVLRRVMCFYFLPPCGKGTNFIPPQAICSEDCFNAMEVCPAEFIFLNNFIQAQNLEAAENATLGLNCSQPALFIDPLPHCCVAVIESADDQGDSSSDVDVLAVSVGVSVGILAVAIAAGVLLMVMRKKVKHYWKTRKGEDSQERQLSIPSTVAGANGLELSAACGKARVSSECVELLEEKELVIPCRCIKLLDLIGKGEFGVVYRAHLTGWSKEVPEDRIVAVKTLRGSIFTPGDIEGMIQEAIKMKRFSNLNVLGLIGVSIDAGEAPYIVMPYMANGSLLAHLKKERVNLTIAVGASEEVVVDAQRALLSMCLQIARGMEYLASHKIVHRDLAARNCMIDANYVIKVADFGLSEGLYARNYYRQVKEKGTQLPMKWMAIESLHDGIFSEKSDVWSFGVTCWEVFSLGRSPYPGVDPFTLVKYLERGQRLEKPSNAACSSEIYGTILHCWLNDPNDRPLFMDLVVSFSTILEGIADYLDLSILSFVKETSL